MTKPIVAACFLCFSPFALADPKLPNIFGDNMVLQAGTKVPIWGTADPFERVDITVAGNHRTIYASKDGYWEVELRNLAAGGPYTLTVAGKATREFTNVLVGEVWLASGQSNMEWSWNHFASNKRPEVGEADFPEIRLFQVTKKASGEPVKDVEGKWVVCNPDSMKGFSLVGFHFARALHRSLKQPVGIIGSYWGGTPAEAWTRMSALESMPETKPMADHYRAIAQNYEQALADYQRKLAEWTARARFTDAGNKGFGEGFALSNFDDITWPQVKLPGHLERMGKPDLDIDGAVWFRRKVDIPADWAGRDLKIELGPIDDADVTYFNGVQVGETALTVADSWMRPRSYIVPAKYVMAGSAMIAVRIFDTTGAGGLYQGPMSLAPVGIASNPMDISGMWKYHIEAGRPTLPRSFWNTQPQQPYGPGSAVAPTNLWNGMIHPLIPFAIKGAIWYQGESNAGRAYQYRSLFPGMIKDWRMAWARPDFPFYFVQLANFMARDAEPVESEWAELREAQTMTLRLKNTGMAVAIDVGEAGDIHPVNKLAVGERLARLALNRDYGIKDIVPSGPMYRSMQVEQGRVILDFDFADMGLATTSGKALKGFAIAGADRKFVWADAKIVGSQVVVSSPMVKGPVAVRYGWANNPEVNLINKSGLPASPFRTDTWPGLTVDRR